MVYTTTCSLRCFKCINLGHKKFACPHNRECEPGNRPIVSGEEEVVVVEHTTQEEQAGSSKVSDSFCDAVHYGSTWAFFS